MVNQGRLPSRSFETQGSYCRQTVTIELYQTIMQSYPDLAKSTSEAKFQRYLFLWLIFGQKDKTTGNPVVSRKSIFSCAKKAHLKLKTAEEGLRIYQKLFPNFTWSGWFYKEGKARICTELGITETPTWEVINQELITNPNLGIRVWFSNGKIFTPQKKNKEERERELREIWEQWQAKVEEVQPRTTEQQELQEYLNNLKPNQLLYRINNNFDLAWQTAQNIPNPSSRIHNLELLTRIWENRQIWSIFNKSIQYRCTENSMRLFSVGETLLGLSKDVRKALCAGWIELDLVSAQTAICAAVWEVKEVIDFLAANQSIWDYLAQHLEPLLEQLMGQSIEANNLKKLLKNMWYAVLFGASIPSKKKKTKAQENKTPQNNYSIIQTLEDWWNNLQSQPLSEEAIAQILKTYKSIDLVKVMLKARRTRLKQFKQPDKTHKLVDINGVTWTKSLKQGYTLLPIEAQSYEFYLMTKVVFDYFKSLSHASIQLWQHDGVTISIKNNNHLEQVKTKLNKKLEQVLKELETEKKINYKIITAIEWEKL